jgi:hypothetical protein
MQVCGNSAENNKVTELRCRDPKIFFGAGGVNLVIGRILFRALFCLGANS